MTVLLSYAEADVCEIPTLYMVAVFLSCTEADVFGILTLFNVLVKQSRVGT